MKKRIICFIMTTALLATTLTGCGEDDAAPMKTESFIFGQIKISPAKRYISEMPLLI